MTSSSNGNPVEVSPEKDSDIGALPDGYRRFVRNSENCILLKESNKGRNHYFYAETTPGKKILIAYFGDIPDDHEGLASLKDVYHPAVVNIDTSNQSLSSSYPPPCPSTITADGKMNYRKIAEAYHRTGYADAIASANNAEVGDMI